MICIANSVTHELETSMTKESGWYVHNLGIPDGPYTKVSISEMIRQGEVLRTTLIQKKRMGRKSMQKEHASSQLLLETRRYEMRELEKAMNFYH